MPQNTKNYILSPQERSNRKPHHIPELYFPYGKQVEYRLH